MFRKLKECIWQGRYSRPWGDESLYHIINNQIKVIWVDDAVTYECPVVLDEITKPLLESVNAIKLRYNGTIGGSFFINEFRQVLSPTLSGDIYLVGELDEEDIIYFYDIRNNNEIISLNDDDNLNIGDKWDRPYMGSKYRINEYYNEIYYWDENDETGEAVRPPIQDEDLIENIRSLRPSGPLSFIVNQYGIVITKVEKNSIWVPTYVGRIDYDQWFKKEDC